MDDKATLAALSAKYDSVKSATINALLKGERVEYMVLKGGLKVTRVRRKEVKGMKELQLVDTDDVIHNHDCERDCALFEKCKIRYLDGDVIKCMHFGNEKNFEVLKE